MPSFGERIRNSWNAFLGHEMYPPPYLGAGSSSRPDRSTTSTGLSRSLVMSIYNRIAVDASSCIINHCRLDDDDNFKEIIKGPLNTALSKDANIDQTGPALMQDAVMSMFDEGCIAVIPTDTSADPDFTDSYQIYKLRVGKIREWYPSHVRCEVYNELTGYKQMLLLMKRNVAIVENPFYATMNEPNSLLQRLIRILNQLDQTNEQNSSGKLDLLIQLPYTIKSEARRIQADKRRKDLEDQLRGAQYGIGYIDATEHVTQLNRGLENNLWSQADKLQTQLYNQLGLTQSIFDGTASETEQLNYFTRTIEPIVSAFTREYERKWLSKTARSQQQAIRYFRDPFKLVPVNNIAEIADKFTRNEILSSNELRAIIGRKPSDDPKADELINANLNQSKEDLRLRNAGGSDTDSDSDSDDEE